MRNIPVFITQYGVASLILESVIARKEAYVRIQSSLEPEKLLEECVSFCKACGAERVYATGDPILERYKLHTAILEMRVDRETLEDTDAALFPVQEETAQHWRQIYNNRMAKVDNAAWMTETAMKAILKEGSAYFIHRDEQLLGIGKASGDRIDAVAATVNGAGAEVVRALAHALMADCITVEVASTNQRAIELYQRLGFIAVKELSKWYQIL